MTQYVVVDDNEGCFLFAFLGIIGFALFKFFEWSVNTVLNWQDLEMPYKIIAGFYYFTIAVPVQAAIAFWEWSDAQAFTQYPNLNLIINITVIAIVTISILYIIKKMLNAIEWNFTILVFLLMIPAMLGGLWFLIVYAFEWITKT